MKGFPQMGRGINFSFHQVRFVISRCLYIHISNQSYLLCDKIGRSIHGIWPSASQTDQRTSSSLASDWGTRSKIKFDSKYPERRINSRTVEIRSVEWLGQKIMMIVGNFCKFTYVSNVYMEIRIFNHGNNYFQAYFYGMSMHIRG